MSPPSRIARTLLRTSRVASVLLLVLLTCAACTGYPPRSRPARTPASPPPPSLATQALRLSVTPASFALPAPVQREVAATSGTRILLAGGLDAGGSSTDGVSALDPSTGAVTRLGRVPNAFHDGAGALIGETLFVFGGGTGQGSDAVQAFDLRSHTGRLAGTLPLALSDLAAATTSDGTVYLVGGFDGVVPQRSIYATVDGSHVTLAARLPVGLRYPAVAAVGTTLVIAGGVSNGGSVASVWLFDTSTRRVARAPPLPAPVGHAAAFALGGKVFIVGGANAAGSPVRSVTEIDPVARTVRSLRPIAHGVSDAGTAVLAGSAWIVGGLRSEALAEVLHASLQQVP